MELGQPVLVHEEGNATFTFVRVAVSDYIFRPRGFLHLTLNNAPRVQIQSPRTTGLMVQFKLRIRTRCSEARNKGRSWTL